MTFNKSSQLLLASAASLLVAAGFAACGSLTTDFVYVASAKAAGPNNYGEIDVFEINSSSGYMRQIPTSPFPSGGRNPVAEAVSPDFQNLYVVNQDDNTIVQFLIGPDGKIYPESTVNTPGIYPLAVAVNGSNLFVLDTYEPLPICSNAEPCPGSVAVFPILAASGSGSNTKPGGGLGPAATNPANGANYWPLVVPSSPNDIVAPTAITILKSGTDAYVAAYDSTSNTGYVFGFSVGAGGALTPLGVAAAGTHPSAIASDPTGSYVYVADSANAGIYGYSIQAGGNLSLLPNVQYNANPYPSGNQPSAIIADPNFPYLYVTNALDGTVSAYEISSGSISCNQAYLWTVYAPGTKPVPPPPPFSVLPAGALCSLGSLSNASSSGIFATGTQPVAMGIDPSTNHFLFTVNFLANGASGTISDFEINTATGGLVHSQLSPYTTAAEPTAVTAVPRGK